MDLEVGAREDREVTSLRASGDGDRLRDIDVGPVAARGRRFGAEPDDLPRTQTAEHTETIVAQLDGRRHRSFREAGRRIRSRASRQNTDDEGARHERQAAARGSRCHASQDTVATTSTSTASLKVNSDREAGIVNCRPLGENLAYFLRLHSLTARNRFGVDDPSFAIFAGAKILVDP